MANSPPPAADAGAAWRALTHDRTIQFAFPDAPPLRPPPPWIRQFLDFLVAHGGWFRYAGYGLLAVIVLAVLYFLVRWVQGGGLKAADTISIRPMPAWQPSAGQARLLLADADALAAQGRFDEAAHLLLLVSIQEIGERRPGAVRPALTAREIGRLEALSPRARQVFSAIAQVVERCLFGGRTLAAADFAVVRAAFEQFTIPQAWAA